MNDLTWTEKDLICQKYGLHIKYKEQLLKLPDMYSDKIVKLSDEKIKIKDKYEDLLIKLKDKIKEKDLESLDEFIFLDTKVLRLTSKQQAVLWEIEGRDLGIFKRTPHGTIYYIDLNAGNDGNTGLIIAQAWRTIEKYTTLTVRTAGDIAYIRANTQEIIPAIVNFDEDGDEDDYIYIIGCDATTDPWGDGSNVKPIINANGGNFYLYLATDHYWNLQNLDLRNGSDMIIYTAFSYNIVLKDFDIHDNGVRGLYSRACPRQVIDGCNFYNNTSQNINFYNAAVIDIKNCIFNGGAGGTINGIYFDNCFGTQLKIIDSSFGQTTAHATRDINCGTAYGITTYMRNCVYNAISIPDHGNYTYGEDDDQVYKAGLIRSLAGTITRDTAIKTGSAEFSLKFEPNLNCGLNYALQPEAFDLISSSYIVNGVANIETTCTIKIRSLGVWVAYPTADELYIEASYLDNAGDCGRSLIQSTTVLIDETTWQSFSVTMTPLRTGPIYINVYLKKYEANKGCYVNGEVVTS